MNQPTNRKSPSLADLGLDKPVPKTLSLEDLGLDSPVQQQQFAEVFQTLDPSVDLPLGPDVQPSVESHYCHPGIAAVLSLVIPGAGQLYRMQTISGLVWLLCTVLAYLIFFPFGIVLHLGSVLMAAIGEL